MCASPTEAASTLIDKSFTSWQQLLEYGLEHPGFADHFAEWHTRAVEEGSLDFDLESKLNQHGTVCSVSWNDDGLTHVLVCVLAVEARDVISYAYTRGIPR